MLSLALLALFSGPMEPLVIPPAPPPAAVEQTTLPQLLKVRRVFVDRFSGGETAAQMRDMVISALLNSKLFAITENEDHADAVLRGSGEDLVFNETHTSSESLNVHSSLGSNESNEDDPVRGGTRTYQRSGHTMGLGAGDSESTHSVERRHEANATVRLVSKDGDVIWSTTQESQGGKFRGASADVADKITRRLLDDYARAQKLPR